MASFLRCNCLILIAVFSFSSLVADELSDRIPCISSADCGNGTCEYGVKLNALWLNGTTAILCKCDKGYTTYEGPTCTYSKMSKVTAMCLSIFLGLFGADWFYLSRGDLWYILAGICKAITGGGAAIWWIVDMFRLGFDSFPDGNGVG